MAYKGGVPVNSGFYPRNDFPIVDAKDIYVSEEQRLDDTIEELQNDINEIDEKIAEITSIPDAAIIALFSE
jgi:prefoldin subunit 5